ncbi:hypothetical protein ACVIJX_008451 [Bradyrhizobium diazoefficiens]
MTAAEGGEIGEPDRKADRLAVPLGDRAVEPRSLAEQRIRDVSLGRLDLVRELFVFGELADEGKNQPGLRRDARGGC